MAEILPIQRQNTNQSINQSIRGGWGIRNFTYLHGPHALANSIYTLEKCLKCITSINFDQAIFFLVSLITRHALQIISFIFIRKYCIKCMNKNTLNCWHLLYRVGQRHLAWRPSSGRTAETTTPPPWWVWRSLPTPCSSQGPSTSRENSSLTHHFLRLCR